MNKQFSTIIDFDRTISRSDSLAEKWNKPRLINFFGSSDLLPFWVADMEFQAPQLVIDSLIKRAQNGVYGYESSPEGLLKSVVQWYSKRCNWNINHDNICISRGILNAIALLIQLHTKEGDGIIIQPPVFFEFRLLIRDNNREVVRNPLKVSNNQYKMDFDDLETKASAPKVKMLILCNPHNPVGRVWTKDELEKVNEICQRHNVLVISDEIHSDIVYNKYTFTPFASISEVAAQNTFVCLSPAKTFNIAAVTDGLLIIANDKYRQQYLKLTKRLLVNKNNAFSNVAMETAYRNGAMWLEQLIIYLNKNIEFMKNYLIEEMPEVEMSEPEGSFLAWLNFQHLNMEAKELEQFLAKKAKVALNSGYWFGREGAGYARMTFACPKLILEQGLSRISQAINTLHN